MSAEKKRIKEQMLINQAINSIKRQYDNLERSRKEYIEAAVTARKNGIASQYNLAKNAIRLVTAQRTVVEQMLLNLQISSQIKDVSEMTKSFADGMKTLSGAITDTTDSLNFEKVNKQMNKAMMSTQLKQAESDEFLDYTQIGFSGLSAVTAADEDEIDKMIDARISGAEAGAESEIEALRAKLGINDRT